MKRTVKRADGATARTQEGQDGVRDVQDGCCLAMKVGPGERGVEGRIYSKDRKRERRSVYCRREDAVVVAIMVAVELAQDGESEPVQDRWVASDRRSQWRSWLI